MDSYVTRFFHRKKLRLWPKVLPVYQNSSVCDKLIHFNATDSFKAHKYSIETHPNIGHNSFIRGITYSQVTCLIHQKQTVAHLWWHRSIVRLQDVDTDTDADTDADADTQIVTDNSSRRCRSRRRRRHVDTDIQCHTHKCTDTRLMTLFVSLSCRLPLPHICPPHPAPPLSPGLRPPSLHSSIETALSVT